MPKAIILAAGKSTRMQSQRQKGLLKLPNGETMLRRAIRQINEVGFEPVIVTGYQREAVDHHCRVKSIFDPFYDTYGSMFAIWWAARALCQEDRVLVTYCDAVVSDNVVAAVAEAGRPETAAVLKGYDGRGIKPVIGDGAVLRTEEASQPDSEGFTYTGWSLRETQALLWLPSTGDFQERGASHAILACGALEVPDAWAVNVNTIEDLAYLRELMT